MPRARRAPDQSYQPPPLGQQLKDCNFIRFYLRVLTDFTAGKYGDVRATHELVLEYGQPYRLGPRSFDGPRRTPKACFMNAARLAIQDPTLTYVEGYVYTGVIPLEHAWCAHEDGYVVDPTLKVVPGDDRVSGYRGVSFTTEYLLTALARNRVWGLFGHHNLPLHQLDDEAFRKLLSR